MSTTIAVTTYEWLKAGHVLAAVLWVGSAFLIQVLMFRATRSGADDKTAYLSGEVEWYGTRFLIPFSLILVILGFGLLHESHGAYSLSDTWVAIGFGVWVASFLTGAGYLGPESGKLSKLLEAKGASDPEYQRRLARIFMVSRVELVLLIIVVLDMVIKPFT